MIKTEKVTAIFSVKRIFNLNILGCILFFTRTRRNYRTILIFNSQYDPLKERKNLPLKRAI
jgi:hypothetical protein